MLSAGAQLGHGMEQGKAILSLSFLLPLCAPSELSQRHELHSCPRQNPRSNITEPGRGELREQRIVAELGWAPCWLSGIDLRTELLNPILGESSPVSPFPGSKPPFRQGLSLQIPSPDFCAQRPAACSSSDLWTWNICLFPCNSLCFGSTVLSRAPSSLCPTSLHVLPVQSLWGMLRL